MKTSIANRLLGKSSIKTFNLETSQARRASALDAKQIPVIQSQLTKELYFTDFLKKIAAAPT